jgi:hypothetical protein
MIENSNFLDEIIDLSKIISKRKIVLKKQEKKTTIFKNLNPQEKQIVIDKTYENERIINLENNIELMKDNAEIKEREWHKLIEKKYPKKITDKKYNVYIEQKKDIEEAEKLLMDIRTELYEKYAKELKEEAESEGETEKELLRPFKFENFAVSLNPYYFLSLRELFDDHFFSMGDLFPFNVFKEHMKNKYNVRLMGESFLFVNPDRKIQPRNKENIKKDFKSILKNSIKEYLIQNLVKITLEEMEIYFDIEKDYDVSIKEKKEALWVDYEKLYNRELNRLLEIKDFKSIIDDKFYDTKETNPYSKFGLSTISHKRGLGQKTLSLLYENDIRTVGQLYELIHNSPKELEAIKGISTNTINLLDNAIESTNFSIFLVISDLNYESMVKEVKNKSYFNFNQYYETIKDELIGKIKTDYPFKFEEFFHPKKQITIWRIYDFERLDREDFSAWRRLISRKGGYWSRYGSAFYFDNKPSKEDLEIISQKYLSFKK